MSAWRGDVSAWRGDVSGHASDWRRTVSIGGLAAMFLAGCGGRPTGSGSATGSASPGLASPVASETGASSEAYCTDHGGTLVDRVATWYHAKGVIRGADLRSSFADQPGPQLPAAFQRRGSGG